MSSTPSWPPRRLRAGSPTVGPTTRASTRAPGAGAIDDLVEGLSRLGPQVRAALRDELAARQAALPGQADRPDRPQRMRPIE
ncbi:hypothetical protein [Nonomuraea sp. KM90]|uniref:hypothetical protein n=1 Tax=Nonomuraea sp. KM90 TaxID=3457428 RepID=UPI003FCDDBF4